jgi:hypothetical protein
MLEAGVRSSDYTFEFSRYFQAESNSGSRDKDCKLSTIKKTAYNALEHLLGKDGLLTDPIILTKVTLLFYLILTNLTH